MTIQWIGFHAGLGNRILALASILALSKIIQSTIVCPWSSNPGCPVSYHELFEDMPGLEINNNALRQGKLIGRNTWEPVLIYQDFKKELDLNISIEEYCLSFLKSIRSLKYNKSLLREFKSYYQKNEINTSVAIHIRRTDRVNFHRKSIHKLFSIDRKQAKRNLFIIKNLGIRKSLCYGFLPVTIIRSFENQNIVKLYDRLLQENSDLNYSICVDSEWELRHLKRCIANAGIAEERYQPSYCNALWQNSWRSVGKRQTPIQHALIECLGMSMSAGILQNIPTSTFSICSSIIGNTPILTTAPRIPCWQIMKDKLGQFPCDIRTDDIT
jgi:hypothetical protein